MDRITFKTPNGFTVTTEVNNLKELFQKTGSYAEILSESECGLCHSTAIMPRVRKAGDNDEYDFYEIVCLNSACRARKEYGQSKDKVSLFPQRKDKEGNWLPNNGWTKYQKEGSPERSHEQPSTPRPEPPAAPSAPSATRQDPPELVAFLNAAQGSKASAVIGQLCDQLRAIGGEDLANQCYRQASAPKAPGEYPVTEDIVRSLFYAVRSNTPQ